MTTPKAYTLVLIQFTILAFLLLSLISTPPTATPITTLTGATISLSGVIIALLATYEHINITKEIPNISPEPKAHTQLVTSGLYKHIRHPIYTGVITTATGAGIAHGNLISIIIALILIPFFHYKAITEEQWLENQDPNYTEYKNTTGRFLPNLSRKDRP